MTSASVGLTMNSYGGRWLFHCRLLLNHLLKTYCKSLFPHIDMLERGAAITGQSYIYHLVSGAVQCAGLMSRRLLLSSDRRENWSTKAHLWDPRSTRVQHVRRQELTLDRIWFELKLSWKAAHLAKDESSEFRTNWIRSPLSTPSSCLGSSSVCSNLIAGWPFRYQ